SRRHLEEIIRHRGVEDWAGFTRDDLTLAPDAPPAQAWLQTHYVRFPINWIARSWWLSGPAIGLIGLILLRAPLLALVKTADPRIAALLVADALLRAWVIASGGQF